MESRSLTSRAVELFDRVACCSVVVAVGMLVLMSTLIVLQVTVRNLFDLGLPWANELARFTGVSLVYLVVPYLHLREQFIAVDIVSSRVRGRARAVLRAVIELATLAFAALTLIGFQQFLVVAGTFTTPAMGIPNWMFFLPALVGIILLTLGGVVRIAALLRGRLPDTKSGAVL